MEFKILCSSFCLNNSHILFQLQRHFKFWFFYVPVSGVYFVKIPELSPLISTPLSYRSCSEVSLCFSVVRLRRFDDAPEFSLSSSSWRVAMRKRCTRENLSFLSYIC